MTATDRSEWVAFLRAIVADPDDDTLRLVAADWLEENGQPERADFIRVQVELARLAASGLGETPQAEALRRRERVYLGPKSHYALTWAAEECPELVRILPREKGSNPLATPIEGADRVTYRRGFVEAVRCSGEEWLQHGAAIRERHPVREVTLTDCAAIDRGEWWKALLTLRGLALLYISGAPGVATTEWLGPRLLGTRVYNVG
ncbi:MAG TPA: TIGR02996 domain-containing protein [Gemmataceae bacterium]|nr:TIGR02996 domain-containing protein [Gemmataceae bacterium]